MTEPIILIHRPNMVRDCWTAEHNGTLFLIIRQVKFEDDGASPQSKMFRLCPEEVLKLWDVINAYIQDAGSSVITK